MQPIGCRWFLYKKVPVSYLCIWPYWMSKVALSVAIISHCVKIKFWQMLSVAICTHCQSSWKNRHVPLLSMTFSTKVNTFQVSVRRLRHHWETLTDIFLKIIVVETRYDAHWTSRSLWYKSVKGHINFRRQMCINGKWPLHSFVDLVPVIWSTHS